MNNTLDKELRDIEAHLASLNPSKMPDDMIARMEQAMISWESNLPVEENIVPFDHAPVSEVATKAQKLNNKTPIWSAAAAIALMAGVASVFMSDSSSTQISGSGIVESKENTVTPAIDSSTTEASLSIASSPELSRNIIHASNEGFAYSDNNDEAFKVLRIEYTEKVITRDSEGNPIITEKPCLEHVLVPVPVH